MSKILCERHNSALSPLDAISARLFQAFDEGGEGASGKRALYLFSGHDLERWLLKVLCGVACSKGLMLDTEADLSIPKEWLEILFGHAEFPNEQGLYVCISRGHRFEGERGVELAAILGQGRLTGMGFFICGYEFILSMSGFPSRSFDGRKVAYRPVEFYTKGEDFEKSVILVWEGKADLDTISFEIVEE